MQLGPSLLPDDDDLELLHQRQYETRVYLVDGGHLLVRGVITDHTPLPVRERLVKLGRSGTEWA